MQLLQAACKRDVRRYVEAVQHDIPYDGTYMATEQVDFMQIV